MQTQTTIQAVVVTYLNATCTFKATTESLRIDPTAPPKASCQCRPCSEEKLRFECPRDRVAGAELIYPGGFRIHYVHIKEDKTKRKKCFFCKTGIIDCGRETASEIVTLVRNWASNQMENVGELPRRMILVWNPKSGKGRASTIVQKRILPTIQNVFGWECLNQKTTGPGVAKQLILSADLSSIDVIGILGGDGTFHEALQGFLERNDWKNRLGIPLVPIPAGSGNALATSLGLYNVDTSLFSIFKNSCQLMDTIWMMYGALSSIDIGTESLRWMGDLRFNIGAFKEIIKMQEFGAKFAFLPLQDCQSDLEIHDRPPPSPSPSIFGNLETSISPEVINWFQHSNEGSQGPDGWIMASNFSIRLLAVLNLPFISESTYFMPDASVDDGAMHLVHVPATRSDGRSQMLHIFLKSESGHHLAIPNVHYSKIRAFLFMPTEKTTWVTVDVCSACGK